MSIIRSTLLAAAETAAYTISRSVRLRSSASAYFNRTFGTPTNNKIWTFSAWVKRGLLSSSSGYVLLSNYTSSIFRQTIQFYQDGIEISAYDTSAWAFVLNTTQVFRDPSAWYHVVVQTDTTQAVASNRIKLYINGVQVTAFNGTPSYPSLNYNTPINTNTATYIGAQTTGSGTFDGYLTEVNFIDGQALTPSSFGETDPVTGVWKPKRYASTYGTNGFYLNFSDNSAATAAAIGKDSSGNGNNWTPNNISVTAGVTYDSMTDVPTLTGSSNANFCTLNPLSNGNTISYANLRVVTATNTNTFGTICVSSGKWYFEATITTAGGSFPFVGIAPSTLYLGSTATSWVVTSQSCWAGNGAFANGDVCGFAFDLDALTFTAYKNNVALSSAYYGNNTSGQNTITSGLTWVPAVSGVSSTIDLNFGQLPFTYTPPSGFKSLNTYNLPAPTITNGAAQMAATTYTGTGSAMTVTNTVNSVSFQPDFLWIKQRNNAANHVLADAIRGVNKYIFSNLTNAEATATAGTGITAFNSNGFSLGTETSTVGSVNAAGGTGTYIAWQWKASNAAAVTNTSGSITSSVSANPTAGFSILTYTGTSAAGTIGHGLGIAPKMIIVKPRTGTVTTDSWNIYHSSIGNTQFLVLDSTAAAVTASTRWNNTSPTSSVFSIGTVPSSNGVSYVAYCFAEIAGFSKFGSYTGNGSTDGPFVYCGFRPRFVMIKGSSFVSNWFVIDTSRNTYNVSPNALRQNLSDVETSTGTYSIDILSNGFKLRSSAADANTNGATFIYAAFAESPFNYSLAR